MAPDLRFLAQHSTHVIDATGISEAFLRPTLGGRRTIAVLDTPPGSPRRTGWVLCHGFAMEHMHLSRLEAIVSRDLARVGFPTLRFHGQGYGDSDGGMEEITLSGFLKEIEEAIELLVAESGVSRVGVVGARFGAMAAALVADRLALPLLVLIQPVANGALYMREFIRSEAFAAIAGEADDEWEMAPSREGLAPAWGGRSKPHDTTGRRVDLLARGWADVNGFRLNRVTYEEVTARDLKADLASFAGRCLVVGVSKEGRPATSSMSLAAHLTGVGARCTMATIADRHAAQLGQYHYASVAFRSGDKADVCFTLNRSIASAVSTWATRADDALSEQIPHERREDAP
jgi:pimeloyl-ACP methyl ester carboxylesterase